MDNLNIIEQDGVIIPLESHWNNVAISVSGGADSALLAYLLSYYISENNLSINIHFTSNIRMWETRPWQRYDSIKVFDYIKNCFPTLNYYRHEHFIPPELETANMGEIIPYFTGEKKGGDSISTFSFATYICKRENIDSWFAALTKNPPTNFSGSPSDRNTEENRAVKTPVEYYNNILISHPFCHKSKDWIIKQYINLDILDLLEQTRSCEGDKNSSPEIFENLDFYSYNPYDIIPTCEKCFWCEERNWALKQNGL